MRTSPRIPLRSADLRRFDWRLCRLKLGLDDDSKGIVFARLA